MAAGPMAKTKSSDGHYTGEMVWIRELVERSMPAYWCSEKWEEGLTTHTHTCTSTCTHIHTYKHTQTTCPSLFAIWNGGE